MTDWTKFRAVKNNRIEKGEILASYRATAELVDGDAKRDLVRLLQKPNSHLSAVNKMQAEFHAIEDDSVRVPREMAEDLVAGFSERQVLEKPYRYTVEMLFFAPLSAVPKNDRHWTVISVYDVDKEIEVQAGDYTIRTRLVRGAVNSTEDLPAA